MAGEIKFTFTNPPVNADAFRRAIRGLKKLCDLAERIQKQNPGMSFVDALEQAHQKRVEKK